MGTATCVHHCVGTAVALCEDPELVHPTVHVTTKGMDESYIGRAFILLLFFLMIKLIFGHNKKKHMQRNL